MLIAALALALAQTVDGAIAPFTPDAPARFPYDSDGGVDVGCLGGGPGASRFPGHIIDSVHHETILYNVSHCSGGFIQATSNTGGRGWSVDFAPGGGVRGKDMAGHAWRYDAAAHRYVVTATGVSCTRPDFRAMCDRS